MTDHDICQRVARRIMADEKGIISFYGGIMAQTDAEGRVIAAARTFHEEEINKVDDLLNNIVDGIDTSVNAIKEALKILDDEEIEGSQELDRLSGKLSHMHDSIHKFVTGDYIRSLDKLVDAIKKSVE